MLSIAGWGWHAEVGLHTIRLIANGVFDRHPNLQIIIGHMGEMIPFFLARINTVVTPFAKLQKEFVDYFHSNIHITTSGIFTAPPFNLMPRSGRHRPPPVLSGLSVQPERSRPRVSRKDNARSGGSREVHTRECGKAAEDRVRLRRNPRFRENLNPSAMPSMNSTPCRPCPN